MSIQSLQLNTLRIYSLGAIREDSRSSFLGYAVPLRPLSPSVSVVLSGWEGLDVLLSFKACSKWPAFSIFSPASLSMASSTIA
jgi:hypothetical protein